MNDRIKEGFEIAALADDFLSLAHQATENDTVRFKAIALAFFAIGSTRDESVDEMCDLVREIAEQTKRGGMIKETAQ